MPPTPCQTAWSPALCASLADPRTLVEDSAESSRSPDHQRCTDCTGWCGCPWQVGCRTSGTDDSAVDHPSCLLTAGPPPAYSMTCGLNAKCLLIMPIDIRVCVPS